MFFKDFVKLILVITAVTLVTSVENLSAQFPSDVSGQIVDDVRGGPVVGARVRVEGSSLVVVSDPSGRFVLRGISPGRNALIVTALGFRPVTVWVTAESGRTSKILVSLGPIEITLDSILVTGTRRVDPTVIDFDADAIRKSGAQDVGDLLESVSGVQVLRQGGAGGPVHISIRGSNPSQVLVVRDGVVLNSPITGTVDVGMIGIEGVERITVFREARGDRFGARALGGVVVIETGAAVGVSSARMGFGSWGNRQLSLNTGRRESDSPLGRFSLRLTGEWQTYGGRFPFLQQDVRGGGFAVRQNADTDRRSLSVVSGLGGDWLNLDFHASGDIVKRGMPGSIVQPSPFARQQEQRGAVGVNVKMESSRVNLLLGLGADGNRTSFADSNPPFAAPFSETTDFRGWSAFATVAFGSDALDWKGGIEIDRHVVKSTMLTPGAPTHQSRSGLWTSLAWRRPVGDLWTVRFLPSLRMDHHSRVVGAVLSPRAAISLNSDTFGFNASIGNGFSPPTLADQFFEEGVLAEPNPDLKPERVRGEVAVSVYARWQIEGWSLKGSGSVSSADVEGMILWFPNYLFIWRPQNVDVMRRTVEVSFTVADPGNNGSVEFGVERTAVRFAGGVIEGQVPYRPEWAAHLRIASNSLGFPINGKLSLVGPRTTVIGSEANSLRSYWWVDLWTESPVAIGRMSASVTGKIVNLLNDRIAMFPDYPMPGRGIQVGLRVEPRRFSR